VKFEFDRNIVISKLFCFDAKYDTQTKIIGNLALQHHRRRRRRQHSYQRHHPVRRLVTFLQNFFFVTERPN
jgi:hypothetical protein